MSAGFSSISDSFLQNDDGENETRDRSKITLCGRTREKLKLLKAYSKVVATNSSEVVVVHGESGSGKTSLVDLLRETACENDGFFVAGKYFLNSGGIQQEPYSAFMAAFSDLCDLVHQSEDFDERKSDIQQALGSDGWLLSNAISRLYPFLDDVVEEGIDIKSEAALAKFIMACKVFLVAMSCREHPIILVLDDIQWMDKGSRGLLTALLSARKELSNILLVLIYREEEQDIPLKLLQNSCIDYVDVQVRGLDADGVHQIIKTLLYMLPSDESRALGQLVHQRTTGNPFYVLRFLDFIQEEGLLLREVDSRHVWKFEVEKIRQETTLIDTIADIMVKNIKILPDEVQQVLKICSMLGFRFRTNVVSEVLGATTYLIVSKELNEDEDYLDGQVTKALKTADQKGFIESTNDGYQFCHDRFQSSFQAMMATSEKPKLHKTIGETLLRCTDSLSRYHSALHLNQATRLLQDDAFDDSFGHIDLVQISLEASKYCKDKCFFYEASKVLRGTLDLVPVDELWERHYQLTLDAMSWLARMQLCSGDIKACHKTTDQIFDHALTVNDKLYSFVTHVDALVAKANCEDIIAFGVPTVSLLTGVRFPSKVSIFHLLYKMIKINKLLGSKSDDDIVNIQSMTDTAKRTAMKILTALGTTNMILRRNKESAFCTLIALEMSLRHGLSFYSSQPLATFAVIQMSLGKFDKARRFGELSIRVGRKFGEPFSSVVIVTMLISHWDQPLHDLIDRMDKSIKCSFATGDLKPAIATCVSIRVCAGQHLGDLEHRYRSFHAALKNLNQLATESWLLPGYQYVLNLRSENVQSWRSLAELTGSVMTQSDFIERAVEFNDTPLLSVMGAHKLQLEFHFGFHAAAEKTFYNYLKAHTTSKSAMRFHFQNIMVVVFFTCINYYELASTQPQRKYLKLARHYKRYLQKIKISDRPNLLPVLTILEAENLASHEKTDPRILEASFHKAIAANTAARFLHMEALANERAAFAFGRRKDHVRARGFFTRAVKLYQDYGAINKVAWLTEKAQKSSSGKNDEQSDFVVETIQVVRAHA